MSGCYCTVGLTKRSDLPHTNSRPRGAFCSRGRRDGIGEPAPAKPFESSDLAPPLSNLGAGGRAFENVKSRTDRHAKAGDEGGIQLAPKRRGDGEPLALLRSCSSNGGFLLALDGCRT